MEDAREKEPTAGHSIDKDNTSVEPEASSSSSSIGTVSKNKKRKIDKDTELDGSDEIQNRCSKSAKCVDVRDTEKVVNELLSLIQEGQSGSVVDLLSDNEHVKNLGIDHYKEFFLGSIKQGNLFLCQFLTVHAKSLVEIENAQTFLILAAKHGMVDIMKFLISFPSLVHISNEVDEDGNSPLMLCQNTNAALSITKLLMKSDKRSEKDGYRYSDNFELYVNTQNKDGKTALMLAVSNRNLDVITKLLTFGSDINVFDKQGKSAESVAEDLGMGGIFQCLNGRNALEIPVKTRNVKLLKLILSFDNSGDPNENFDTEIGTSLQYMFHSKTTILENIEQSLPASSDPNCSNHNDSDSLPNNCNSHNKGTDRIRRTYSQFTDTEMEIMKVLLDNGADICNGDEELEELYGIPRLFSPKCPLITAVSMELKTNNCYILKFLLDHTKLIWYRPDCFAIAVEGAVKKNRPDIVRTIVPFLQRLSQSGVSLLSGNEYLSTDYIKAFTKAVDKGYVECVRSLLCIVLNDISVFEVVTRAIQHGHYAIYELLTQDFSKTVAGEGMKGYHGSLWLIYACFYGRYDIAENLLKSGAPVNGIKGASDHPFLVPPIPSEHPLSCSLTAEIAELLIKYGADLNILEAHDVSVGTSALCRAVEVKSFNMFKLLLDNNVKITAEVLQSFLSQINVIDMDNFQKVLVENICEIDPSKLHITTEDPWNFNLLVLAIRQNNIHVLKALLENNVRTDFIWTRLNGKTFSPLTVAVSLSHLDIVKMMVVSGADIHGHGCFPTAVQVGNIQMVRFLLESGADMNSVFESRKESSLAVAARKSHFHIIKLLVGKGAEVNLKSEEHSPTPLINAIVQNDLEVVKYLLDNGADVNLRGGAYGNTPLIQSVIFRGRGHCINPHTAEMADTTTISALSLLLENGANTDMCNEQNKEALFLAYHMQDFETFSVLITYGALGNLISLDKSLLTLILKDDLYHADTRFSTHLIKHGGEVSSEACAFAIHGNISFARFDVASALIHSGQFSPQVLCSFNDDYLPYMFRGVSYRNTFTSLNGYLSPICMALLCSHIQLANDLLRHGFVTSSDLTSLARNSRFLQLLVMANNYDAVNFLDANLREVPSLFKLSFARVCELLGNSPGRRDRVRQLKLPSKIENVLLFAPMGDPIVATPNELARPRQQVVGMFELYQNAARYPRPRVNHVILN